MNINSHTNHYNNDTFRKVLQFRCGFVTVRAPPKKKSAPNGTDLMYA